MAGKTKTMTQIKKILRGIDQGWSLSKVSRETGISRNTIRNYRKKAKDHDSNIKELLDLADHELREIMLEPSVQDDIRYTTLQERLSKISQDLSKVGVTRSANGKNIARHILMGMGTHNFVSICNSGTELVRL